MDKGSTLSQTNEEELLCSEDFEFYRVSLFLRCEKMECVARLELLSSSDRNPSVSGESVKTAHFAAFSGAAGSRPAIKAHQILWLLYSHGIFAPIDYPAIYELCADVELSEAKQEYVVARGREPETGADGWFELLVKITGEDQVFAEDDCGNVDLRNLNAYSEIEAEQKLGVVHPPSEGSAGMNVVGEPIAADAGQPCQIRAGEGVQLKYNNRIAFSEKEGRALWENGVLSVVDQLAISGDLDMATGNIDFNGFVEIKGEVPDGFVIKATKGIKIGGLVGAACLETGGSVELVSMSGKDAGEVHCRGDFKAVFLNQVRVVSYGDISIAKEVRNCTIKSTGKLVVAGGAIVGGFAIAMEGIECKSVGTLSGQKTDLTAGIYFPDVDRFDLLRQKILQLNGQLNNLQQALDPLQHYVRVHPTPLSAAHKRYDLLNKKRHKLLTEKEHLSAELSASTTQSFYSQNAKINIRSELHEGVLLTLGSSCEEIKIARRGPLTIIENSVEGGLRYLDFSPLNCSADQDEQKYIVDLI